MAHLFLSHDAHDRDADLFFGEIGINDTLHRLSPDADMAEMAVMAGIFPSKGQARKNGWDGKIPEGFGMKTLSKKRLICWFKLPEAMKNDELPDTW